MTKIKRKNSIFYPLIILLLFLVFFFSACFYNGHFFWEYSEKWMLEILKFGTIRFFISAGIGMSIYLSVVFLQTLIKNSMASPSILGISQINLIVYALVFIINKPLFEQIFLSRNVNYRILEWILYFGFSFLISSLIISIAKNLNSRFIVVLGIFLNVILSGISLLLLKSINSGYNETNILFKKMLGSFTAIDGGKKVYTFMIAFSNSFGILGLMFWKIFRMKIEKNLILKNYGKTIKGSLIRSRIILVGLTAFYSSIAFYMSGAITFFGIAVVMLAKQIFGNNQKDTLIPGFLISIVFVSIIDILELNVFKKAFGDISEGLYLSLIGIPIIIVQLFKKGGIWRQ